MRIFKSFTLVILIGIAAVGMSISSRTQAAIIGANVAGLGGLPGVVQDGFNVTRDLDNNLDWLDWTLTTNLSFNTVTAAAGLLGTGQLLDGWRYATESEFVNLLISAGIPNTFYDQFVNTTNPGLPFTTLMSSLGITTASFSQATFDTSNSAGTRAIGAFKNTGSAAGIEIPNAGLDVCCNPNFPQNSSATKCW